MGKAKDLTGQKIGRLKLIKRVREKKRTYYYCECDCGNKVKIRADSLNGNTKSCGCLGVENQFKAKDISNKRFGKLIAIAPTKERDKDNGSVIWECRCDCKKKAYVAEYRLTNLEVRSCGCLGKEVSKSNIQKAVKKHLEVHIVEGTNIPIISKKSLNSNNTSGITGVTWDKSRNMWQAFITFKGINYYLGRRSDKKEAAKLRVEAEKNLFGNFLNWYNKEFKEHVDKND